MKTLILSIAVLLLFLLGDWRASRNAEAVVRDYALAFDPAVEGRVEEGVLPPAPDLHDVLTRENQLERIYARERREREEAVAQEALATAEDTVREYAMTYAPDDYFNPAPAPPAEVVTAFRKVMVENPTFAIRVSVILLLRTQCHYLTLDPARYEADRPVLDKRIYAGLAESVFVSELFPELSPRTLQSEIVGGGESAAWQGTIRYDGGPLAAEVEVVLRELMKLKGIK